jgi:diguanylate cyclase (GGDEF)-like protein
MQEEVDRLNETVRALTTKNSELERKIGDLEEKLFRCPITGLYNENFFRRYIRGAVDVSLDVNADGALLFISIDHFSEVNIRHGSAGANETLKKFALALPNSVPPETVVFRMGGALFACYIAWADRGLAAALAERIRSDTETADIYVEPITVSIGVVNMSELTDQKSEDRAQLVERLSDRAKRRLDIARRKGMNSVCAEEDFDVEEEAKRAVVLIDQEPFRRELFATLLRHHGFAVHEESNGADALNLIQREHPALIVADLYIPGLDSISLREKLRESSDLARIPYVIVSDRRSADIASRAYDAGVTVILQRPILIEELIGLAKNLSAWSERHAG